MNRYLFYYSVYIIIAYGESNVNTENRRCGLGERKSDRRGRGRKSFAIFGKNMYLMFNEKF